MPGTNESTSLKPANMGQKRKARKRCQCGRSFVPGSNRQKVCPRCGRGTRPGETGSARPDFVKRSQRSRSNALGQNSRMNWTLAGTFFKWLLHIKTLSQGFNGQRGLYGLRMNETEDVRNKDIEEEDERSIMGPVLAARHHTTWAACLTKSPAARVTAGGPVSGGPA